MSDQESAATRRAQDEDGSLFDGHFGAKLELAETRVYTNDLDALEALVVGGLPPDEMQAAAWVLVQRVRGLHADLARLQRSLVRARVAAASVPRARVPEPAKEDE
jgi:hypothetical protein